MTIKTTAIPTLPPVPVEIKDPIVQRYLSDLHRSLQLIVQGVHEDLAHGESTLTGYTAAPTTANVDANQLAVRTDAGNETLYINIGGTMFSVGLT